MKTVCGKYPLSNNPGAARNWIRTTGDGPYVPRPDCSLTTLTIVSVVAGLFGIDHFYLRSPLTGVAKMLTGGGIGLWWLWDVLQLTCERERVLTYGLSVPFDVLTGIGQGMITDQKTNYTSDSSFSLWLFGIIFGFIGIDSLIAKNGGQFLRKLLEFSLFMMSLLAVAKVFSTGVTFGWIFALICMCYLGSIIIAEYISVLTIVLGSNVFDTGVEVTDKEDKQYNSLFKWMVNAVNEYFLSKELKAQIITDLQYGGITAKEIKDMFNIFHAAEKGKRPDLKPPTAKDDWGSWMSFLVLIFSPIIILLSAIYSFFAMIWEATPWGRASKLANAALSGDLTKIPGVGKAATTLMSTNPLASAAAKLASENPLAAAAKMASENPLAAAAKMVSESTAAANPLVSGTKPQAGGAKQALSLESQIMGASIIALIAGGSLKGLVDYLVVE